MKKVLNVIKYFDEKFIFPNRYSKLTKLLKPHLYGCKSVLDVGASCGRLSKRIQDEFGGNVKFEGVDTHVQDETFIPIKEYNGKKLPFKDNSFDCVLIVDVLHHTLNQEEILNEAKRVSKKFILIKDHYWVNSFDFFVLKIADYLGNKPYGVDLPYNFLKLDSWNSLFKNLDLKVIYSKKYGKIFNLFKQVIFKLEKEN